LLDRIDIHIEVVPVPFGKLSEAEVGESSDTVRERVIIARNIQEERFKEFTGIHSNSQMTSKMMSIYCSLDSASSSLLKNAMERLGLSARAYDRILKVSRTIADLEKSENIKSEHIAEAIQYRSLDRESWGSH
jgi:magnesium chelatase family protein